MLNVLAVPIELECNYKLRLSRSLFRRHTLSPTGLSVPPSPGL
jgi:hypothetical protein